MLFFIFLLTRLLRGATYGEQKVLPAFEFLLTRLLRGATISNPCSKLSFPISTHAPLTRRDAYQISNKRKNNDFYSRASYEARLMFRRKERRSPEFLLTRLLRGATKQTKVVIPPNKFLLTRLLRGATS